MLFQNVIGQNKIKEKLIQSVKDGHVSHSQLITGPEGCGKLAIAIAYAQYISCLNPQENDSCGECSSCKRYQRLVHPDLHFVFPVVRTKEFKKPVSKNFIEPWWRTMVLENPYFNVEDWYKHIGVENAQGLIYSQESNEIIRTLSMATYESEYKVMIIWLPEKMHVFCANKLLKMIEEPPKKTLFLLVSEDEEHILPTIRSRCQLIKMNGIENEPLAEALRKLPQAAGKDIESIVHLSRGNYRKAMELLLSDDEKSFNLENFMKLMRLTYTRKFPELFDWVSEIAASGREKQKSFLQYSLNLLRENFIYNLKNPELYFMDKKEESFSSKFSPFINEKNIIPLSEELEKGYRDISMNGNPSIIFTDISMKITKLIR